MVTWYSAYVDIINFNELLWNYEFIYYENLLSLKIRPFYKNLEPYCTNFMDVLQLLLVYVAMWPLVTYSNYFAIVSTVENWTRLKYVSV